MERRGIRRVANVVGHVFLPNLKWTTKNFFENASSLLQNKNPESKKITVIVSGGFHGSLSDYLKDSGFSCITLTPEISGYDSADNTYEKILLESVDGVFYRQALANMLFILIKSPVIPQRTKYFFSKQLILNVIKVYNTSEPEKIKEILFDISKKYGTEI